MPVNEFSPFAAEAAANVVPVGTYQGSGFQENGQQPGIALSEYFNRAWRQGGVWGCVLASFIVAVLSEDVLDSGYANGAAEVTTLQAQFEAALTAYVANTTSPSVDTVAFSATPVFNCGAANPLNPKFEITLTGNVTSSTIIGLQPGQTITLHIVQDGTGGHTFAPPAALPLDDIDPAANQVCTQSFHVLADGTTLVAAGAMTLKN